MSSFDSTVTPIFNALSAPSAHSDPSAPRWFLLHPSPSSPSTLTLLASGPDPAVQNARQALESAVDSNEFVYGYLLVPSPGPDAELSSKGVVLTYIAQSVGGVKRARAVVGGRGIASLFPDYSALVTIASAEELTEDMMLSKLGLNGISTSQSWQSGAVRSGTLTSGHAADYAQDRAPASREYSPDARDMRKSGEYHDAPHVTEQTGMLGSTSQGGSYATSPPSTAPSAAVPPATYGSPVRRGQFDAEPATASTYSQPDLPLHSIVPAPMVVPVIQTQPSPSQRGSPAPVFLGPVSEPSSAASVVSPLASDPFPHPDAQRYDPTQATPLPQSQEAASYAFPQTEATQGPTAHGQTSQQNLPVGNRAISSAEYFNAAIAQDRARKTSLGQKLGGVFGRSASANTTASSAATPAEVPLPQPGSPASPKENSGRFKPSKLFGSLGKKRGSISASGTPPGSPDPRPNEFGANSSTSPPPLPPKGDSISPASYPQPPRAQGQYAEFTEYRSPPIGSQPAVIVYNDAISQSEPAELYGNGHVGRNGDSSLAPHAETNERGLSPSPSAKAALAQMAQMRGREEEEMMARYRDAERQRKVSASSREPAVHGQGDDDGDSIRLAYDDPESPEKPGAGPATRTDAPGGSGARLRPTMPGGTESFGTPTPTPGLESGVPLGSAGVVGAPHGLQRDGAVGADERSMLRLEGDAERGAGLQSSSLASDRVGPGSEHARGMSPFGEGEAGSQAYAREDAEAGARARQRAQEAEDQRRRAAEEEEARIRAEEGQRAEAERADRERRAVEAAAAAAAAERARLEAEEHARAEEMARVQREEQERLRAEEEERRRREEEKARIRREEEERVRLEEEARMRKEREERERQEAEKRARREAEERARREEEERVRREEEEKVRREEEERRRVEDEQRARKQRVREGLERGKREGGIMLSGWINAQNARSPIWRRRWFKLSGGQMLLFKTAEDTKPMSTVQLPASTAVAETFEESQVQGSWKVASGEGDEWFMYADSLEDREAVLMGLEMARA